MIILGKMTFKGKKVLIMGLGLNGGGVGAAKFFCEQGADVLVTDLKTEKQLAESVEKLKRFNVEYSLGGHKESDFISADLIVKNPDVPSHSPYLQIAKKHGVPIESDVNLFFKLAKCKIIGVTGTKGKSTTASLIYHLLKAKYKKTYLAGNIGVSPLELLPKIKRGGLVVLELSSFELEDLTYSPNIAVITNILPDHLNRYGTMEDYIEAKKIIFEYQTKKDFLILNGDDPIVSSFSTLSKAKKIFFSIKQKPRKISLDGFRLFGKHNLSNLLSAITVAKLMKVSDKRIQKALTSFAGVPNRQEFIAEINGVKYFNDTTATMPEAAIIAINAFAENFPKSKLIFICGGMNKGLQYDQMAEAIKEKVNELIMLPGVASDKIKDKLLGYNNLHNAFSMQGAVNIANELAEKGSIVVLSPGATSFNLFKNEFDRGNQFVNAVKKISGQ